MINTAARIGVYTLSDCGQKYQSKVYFLTAVVVNSGGGT